MINKINKKLLREKYLSIRKNYPIDELKKKTNLINEKLIELIKENNFFNIGFYFSINNEVSLKRTFLYCQNNKINCYFPKIINDEIKFVKVNKPNEFLVSKYNISAPKNNNFLENINLLDVIFTPCVAFSLKFYRIGYGKGYYDKFFQNFYNLKVIVAFDFQKIEENIEFETYDQKVNLIITEKNNYCN